MGYLNSDSITVDAILTKHGRYKLSLGGGLDIQYFALSDDGMDYSLWNEKHPSGSDSYGEALTSLPQIEAVPDDVSLMQYKLYHGDRDKQHWPVITKVSDHVFNNTVDYIDIIPETEQFGTESYMWQFSNSNIIRFDTPNVDQGHVIGATDSRFPVRTNIPLALEFRGVPMMRLYAKSLDTLGITNVNIIGQSSGARTSITLTVKNTL